MSEDSPARTARRPRTSAYARNAASAATLNHALERQIDAQLGFVGGILIILSQPLANFGRRGPHHRIEVCVVIRLSAEHVDPERAFLQIARAPVQGVLDRIPQKVGITPAVFE